MSSLPLGEQLKRRKPLSMVTGHAEGGLQRTLTTFQLTMFGVGATVGTGIFFVLVEAVPKAGPAVLVSFLLAGVAAGLSALCYAELASAIPASGSTYSYAYHALGEFMAVIIAACVLLEYGVSTSAVAVGWSGYFNELLDQTIGVQIPEALSYSPIIGPGDNPGPTGLINLPAVVLVLMCMSLLIRGATESAKINAVMVLIKLGVLVMFAVIAVTAYNGDHFNNFFDKGFVGISAAAGTIFFSFIGLDAVSTAGEEVKDPQRALPRALIAALFIVVAVYLLVAFAGLAAVSTETYTNDNELKSAGLAVILERVTGSSIPAIILSAGAVISIFSVTLVTLYGQTRILFAIGRDGLLPERFAKVNPRTMTPTFNTIVCASIIAIIAGFVPAGYLWDTVSIGTLSAFIVVSIGIIVLRRREPGLHRPFRVPGYPVTPILSIAACVYILWGLPSITWVIFLCWVAVVVAFYFAYGRKHAALNRLGSDVISAPRDPS